MTPDTIIDPGLKASDPVPGTPNIRVTIDYGIDLGTTNSEIAVFSAGETEVIKNIEQFENTPSAVWIDAKRRLFVGHQAKAKVEEDPDNAKQEFKRLMGRPDPLCFPASGREMLPEELSAEVLKQLRLNVMEWKGEEINAAVITVPADFNAAQIEATNRAARLAGLVLSPLVQEPVAAATAYGFQSDSDKVRWLVYDFGGGTFDAALIHMRDGMIRVENHGGNKVLGGKEIDKAIVDEVLVPEVVRQFQLRDFNANNAKWRSAFAKLKIEAERAKIRLSRAQSAVIDIRGLFLDGDGKPVDFEYELQRPVLERLAEPFIARTINICREVLAEKRLEPADIEKIILVGGPTLMPYLRQRLADKAQGLGIPLEFSIDPFTVVARGAAVFAATQPAAAPAEPPRQGEYQVRLDYRAIGPDTEPPVAGQVLCGDQGADLSGHTIEFVNRASLPPWRSGKVGLSAEGGFICNLWAQSKGQSIFHIELCDGTGARLKASPESFPYTVGGGAIDNQPLIHSIGVALADGTTDVFFEKGTPLPARLRRVFRTTVDARRGQADGAGDMIRVPVVEGENRRARRNEVVGSLEIPAGSLKRDVPAGSEIEVTIEVDESRRYITRAYLPILDEEFERQLIKHWETPSADELSTQMQQEKKRIGELREKARKAGDPRVTALLERVEKEGIEHEADRALLAARNDRDAADTCADRLRHLQIALDEVEEGLEWPDLVVEANQEIKTATETVAKHGNASDKRHLAVLVDEVRAAIDHRDPGGLRTKHGELQGFRFRVWSESIEFIVGVFKYFESERGQMTNQAEASRLFALGQRAINNGDVPGLKAVNQQLVALLPKDVAPPSPGSHGSTVERT